MPVPKLGSVVWRYGDRSGKACTALVTGIYHDTIDCMVFPSGEAPPQPKTGCRHVDDPTLRDRTAPNPGGLFELCDVELKINAIYRHAFGPDEE